LTADQGFSIVQDVYLTLFCIRPAEHNSYVEPAVSKAEGGVAPLIVCKLRVLLHATKMHADTVQTDRAGELRKDWQSYRPNREALLSRR
jgi:hypothetical protein